MAITKVLHVMKLQLLRIGHTRLTHSYLLSGDDQPTCSTCGHPLTVVIYCWTALIYEMSDKYTSLLPVGVYWRLNDLTLIFN